MKELTRKIPKVSIADWNSEEAEDGEQGARTTTRFLGGALTDPGLVVIYT